MKLEVGNTYTDRRGTQWLVICTDGQRIAPVTAGRWEGKSYLTRTFQHDGRYWSDGRDDPWDLVTLSHPARGRVLP